MMMIVSSGGEAGTAGPAASANAISADHDQPQTGLERKLFLLLSAVALLCAVITGMKTVMDPDLFWQLATGRWVAQHHHVFSTDVFSYTAAGQPWIYPVGSGLLFYGLFLLGGYLLLSSLGAAACCGTVALLLRKGSAVTAAVAIVALPLIAGRSNARAEMFTLVLFAAYLSILWEHYRTGRARLWIMPLLMLAWVNLHLGFVSGLGLIAAFVAIDVLEMPRPSLRAAAVQRLRNAYPWFAATAVATLANPWGWNLYAALIRQQRAMAEHSEWIAEWGKAPLSWNAFARAISIHHPNAFYFLLLIAVIAIIAAMLQREVGATLLLCGALYEGVQHIRMEALTACVVVIVGAAMLLPVAERIASRLQRPRLRWTVAVAAAAMVIAVAAMWSVKARQIDEMSLSSYGLGLAWWLPERAVQFLNTANIPGEIFNTYQEGGYVVWRLGLQHRDSIDGRAIPFGPQAFLHQVELLGAPPDSPLWQAEADRYNINAILLPLNRFQSEFGALREFCSSTTWAPVYVDELAGVFVRRRPETEELIRRARVDCATVRLPAAIPTGGAGDRYNAWANAAVVLTALGRNLEALAAADQAGEALPNSSLVPWVRGNVSYAMGMRADAERHYLQAIARNPEMPLTWFSLAAVYKHEGRIADTIHAQRTAIDLSTMPQPQELLKLARLYLDTQQPRAALATFDEAERSASPDILTHRASSFQFQVDQGRAAAWRALGDLKQASAFDQKAAQDLLPEN